MMCFLFSFLRTTKCCDMLNNVRWFQRIAAKFLFFFRCYSWDRGSSSLTVSWESMRLFLLVEHCIVLANRIRKTEPSLFCLVLEPGSHCKKKKNEVDEVRYKGFVANHMTMILVSTEWSLTSPGTVQPPGVRTWSWRWTTWKNRSIKRGARTNFFGSLKNLESCDS